LLPFIINELGIVRETRGRRRVDPVSGDDEFTTRSVGDDVSPPSELRDEPSSSLRP